MPQDSNSSSSGKAPNQFAQVGMGGSQGGGQFEQGEGRSGSLQDQQGGTTTRSTPLGEGTDTEFDNENRDTQQQQDQSRQRSPGFENEDDDVMNRDSGNMRREGNQNFGQE